MAAVVRSAYLTITIHFSNSKRFCFRSGEIQISHSPYEGNRLPYQPFLERGPLKDDAAGYFLDLPGRGTEPLRAVELKVEPDREISICAIMLQLPGDSHKLICCCSVYGVPRGGGKTTTSRSLWAIRPMLLWPGMLVLIAPPTEALAILEPQLVINSLKVEFSVRPTHLFVWRNDDSHS